MNNNNHIYIFLDIDGVLNCELSFKENSRIAKKR